MTVLVDTPIWSLALRRQPHHLSASEQRLVQELAELVRGGNAHIVGPIRQELLSGIKDEVKFGKLRDYLRAFDEPSLQVLDYEEAARMNNLCRSRGIAGSAIDFLICAVAARNYWQVFTTDRDFARYAKTIPVRLYDV